MNIIKSAIDDIKATDEFKEKLYNSTIENSKSRVTSIKHRKHLISVLAVVIIISIIFVKYKLDIADKRGYTQSVNNVFYVGTASGNVCDMILSNSKLFYTNYENKLFYYDNSLKTGKLFSNIENSHGSPLFEEGGYIYYSNGKSIFKRHLKDNTSKQLLMGENISVNAVHDGKLFYSISYKENDSAFTESEHHIYDLSTNNDSILFDRSKDFFYLLAVDKNTIIADAYLKNDSGLFYIDLVSREKKKLLNIRVHEGCIINENFYYTSHDEKGLWAITTNEGKQRKIPITMDSEEDFFVDRITGYGDFLYIAAYYNGENHIVSIDLQTYDTNILVSGLGRVWNLCTDGQTLYSYDTKSPTDMEGQITVINLE